MKKNNSPRFRIYAVLLLFFAAVFLLPACRTGDAGMYLVAAAVPGVMLLLLAFPSVFMYYGNVFIISRAGLPYFLFDIQHVWESAVEY